MFPSQNSCTRKQTEKIVQNSSAWQRVSTGYQHFPKAAVTIKNFNCRWGYYLPSPHPKAYCRLFRSTRTTLQHELRTQTGCHTARLAPELSTATSWATFHPLYGKTRLPLPAPCYRNLRANTKENTLDFYQFSCRRNVSYPLLAKREDRKDKPFKPCMLEAFLKVLGIVNFTHSVTGPTMRFPLFRSIILSRANGLVQTNFYLIVYIISR